MIRVALYARYSSDNQRDASIEDQLRLCREYAKKQGWHVVEGYNDRAKSGASLIRPGIQALLTDASRGLFDMVLAEALDRISRDQEDVAGVFKRLSFAGIKIVTLSEGEINELHVGLKGTMNALFLKDLAQKVRRGLESRVREGRSGGGLGYGYQVVREFDPRGELLRGKLAIDETKAGIVRRIFDEYALGRSPRAIAASLNMQGIPGPQGKSWGPSTIYGNWRRGTGILNNELYAGRRVWNRQRFVKDPSSGKRVTRFNPEGRLIIQNVPELRIVPEELWHNVKERQQHTRHAVMEDRTCRSERARRPAYLLSGLLRCGVCGGGFSKRSETHYACSIAHDRGTCSNLLRIRRDILEASVLSGLKTHLMRPELVREFIAEFHREIARLTASADLGRMQKKDELAHVNRDIRALIDAIKSGLQASSLQEELLRLEARRDELVATAREMQPRLVRLHPNLANIYKDKVEHLHQELTRESVQAEATELLRSLIREIRLIPEGGQLEIELHGDLATILAFADNNPRRATSAGAIITLVAGEGFEPPTSGL